jgi:CRP-like cAMP-binding protein
LRQDAPTICESDPYVVTLPAPKAVVASRLNVTPEHFSRILHDLAEAGLIKVDGREVTIFAAARLRDHHG